MSDPVVNAWVRLMRYFNDSRAAQRALMVLADVGAIAASVLIAYCQ